MLGQASQSSVHRPSKSLQPTPSSTRSTPSPPSAHGHSPGSSSRGQSSLLLPSLGLMQPRFRSQPVDSNSTRTRAIYVEKYAEPQGEAVPQGGRHAFLHDFCMAIPWGLLTLLGGALSLFRGGGQLGGLAAATGATCLLASLRSLKVWKEGRSNLPYTALEAVSAGLATAAAGHGLVQGWRGLWAGIGLWGLFAPSAALTLFLLYNMAAGGNPPKKSD